MLAVMNEGTALERVMGITELMEHILTSLSIKDVLIAQRVDKRFHEIVTKSPTVQKYLFLAATKPAKGWIVANMSDTDSADYKYGREPQIVEEINHPTHKYAIYSGFVQKAELNLALFTDTPPPNANIEPQSHNRRFYEGQRIWVRLPIQPIKRGSSYMDMFVTQPPAKLLTFFIVCRMGISRQEIEKQKIHLYRADGIRYGHILEAMRNAVHEGTCPGNSFILRDSVFVTKADELRINYDLMDQTLRTWEDHWRARVPVLGGPGRAFPGFESDEV